MNVERETELELDGVELIIREAETQHGRKVFTTFIDREAEIISRYQFQESPDGNYVYERRDKKQLPPFSVIAGMEQEGYSVTNVPSFTVSDDPVQRAIKLGELLKQVEKVYESQAGNDIGQFLLNRLVNAGWTLRIVVAMAEVMTESEFIRCVEQGVEEAKIHRKISSIDDLYGRNVTIGTLQKITIASTKSLPDDRQREVLERVSELLDMGDVTEGEGEPIDWGEENVFSQKFEF